MTKEEENLGSVLYIFDTTLNKFRQRIKDGNYHHASNLAHELAHAAEALESAAMRVAGEQMRQKKLAK